MEKPIAKMPEMLKEISDTIGVAVSTAFSVSDLEVGYVEGRDSFAQTYTLRDGSTIEVEVNAIVLMEMSLPSGCKIVDEVFVIDKLNEDGINMAVVEHANGWQRTLFGHSGRVMRLIDMDSWHKEDVVPVFRIMEAIDTDGDGINDLA